MRSLPKYELEKLLEEAKGRLLVSEQAAEEYEKKKDLILDFVTSAMSKRENLIQLKGKDILRVIISDCRNHINLMINVLSLCLPEVLIKVLPSIHTFYCEDFFYDYFLAELESFRDAAKALFSESSRDEIMRIYDWLIGKHKLIIDLSITLKPTTIELEHEWKKKKNQFLSYILEGDFEEALKFTKKVIKECDNILDFYVKILHPALYKIGSLWEKGNITIAEEHLATSTVGRVMAYIYLKYLKFFSPKKSKSKALVLTPPNELHELGARIVADLLEIDGWDVLFLGANVSKQNLIEIVKKNKPKLVAFSITMPFNLKWVKETIGLLKNIKISPKVIVGGFVFNLAPDLYKKLDADYWAKDAKEAVEIARKIK